MTLPPTGLSGVQPTQRPWPSFGGTPLVAGDHICALYRGVEQRDALLEDFLVSGLRAGQKCVFLSPRMESESIVSRITSQVSVEQSELFSVEDSSARYLQDGTFSGDHIMAFWESFAQQTYVLEHHEFGRAACEVTWIESLSTDELARFVEYEKQVTALCRAHPQIALCLYDLNRLPASVILSILKIHSKVLFSQMVLDNPYATLA
jgi:hypothetical protein